MVVSTKRLRQVLNTRKLVGLRRLREVGGQLVQPARRRRVALRLRLLRRLSQVCRKPLRQLLVFGRIRLLKLLQRTQHARKRRQAALIPRHPDRRQPKPRQPAGRRPRIPISRAENRRQVILHRAGERRDSHAPHRAFRRPQRIYEPKSLKSRSATFLTPPISRHTAKLPPPLTPPSPEPSAHAPPPPSSPAPSPKSARSASPSNPRAESPPAPPNLLPAPAAP